MNRNSIRWRLPASYAVIALLAALALGSVMLLVLKSYYARQEREYLFGNAVTLKPILENVLQSNLPQGALQDQINGLAFLSQTRIRLFDTNGNTIADSGVPNQNQFIAVGGAPSWDMPFFGSSSEPATEEREKFVIYSNVEESSSAVLPFNRDIPASGPAPQGDVILSVRASPYGYAFVGTTRPDPTRRSSQIAKVQLIGSQRQPLGELEFSDGPGYGADVIGSVTSAWLLASAFAIMVAALAGWFMSKRVTSPVLALEEATRQMEQGNLHARVDLPEERQQEFLSLANSFNGMAAQVEQTVTTLREFVADAAHELHTPLTALQANIELARDEKNDSERTRYLTSAQEQGRRLEVLVQSLLDLSRIEAASQSGFEPVNITQLARELGEQFASQAEQTDRTFTMLLPADDIQVLGNETQLRQVLINLLENAVKFTPAQGTIALHLEQQDAELKIIVSDSGIGVPPEDMPHIFERFHRGRNVAEYPGNGLGLAIVKAIVDTHAGNIDVQSQSGRGTQISLSLSILS